jgi:hypothetical protein
MARTVSLDLLESIRVASPCTADWDTMSGDGRSRFCSQCKLTVYNLSAMTADEGAAFIQSREGRTCIRLYRRSDGTVITQDCPVGLRAVRRKAARAMARVAAAGFALLGGVVSIAAGQKDGRLVRLGYLQPFSTIRHWLTPGAPSGPIQTQVIMGDVCFPPPNAPVTPPARSPSPGR